MVIRCNSVNTALSLHFLVPLYTHADHITAMFQGCIAVNKSDRLNYAGYHCRYATNVTDCQSAPAIRTFLSPAASHLLGVH